MTNNEFELKALVVWLQSQSELSVSTTELKLLDNGGHIQSTKPVAETATKEAKGRKATDAMVAQPVHVAKVPALLRRVSWTLEYVLVADPPPDPPLPIQFHATQHAHTRVHVYTQHSPRTARRRSSGKSTGSDSGHEDPSES